MNVQLLLYHMHIIDRIECKTENLLFVRKDFSWSTVFPTTRPASINMQLVIRSRFAGTLPRVIQAYKVLLFFTFNFDSLINLS